MFTWHQTSVKGLRFRYNPTRTRKKGIKTQRDVFYQYRHTVGETRLEEGFGWLFDGMTLEKAISKVHELKENKTHGTGPTTLKAKRLKQNKDEKAQKKADEEIERKNIKFSDVWGKYLEINKATKRTRKGWKREVPLFERYLAPVIGNLPIGKIAPFHFEMIKKNMGDLHLTPRTIKYALAVARQVFNYAIRNDIFYGKNPVSQVKPPEADNSRLSFFSRDEADNLLSELKTKDLDTYTMVLLAFRCGLRSSEILKLTWGVIDFGNEQIQILDTKNSKNRHAFMTDDLKQVLVDRHSKSQDA
ncbi:MAG: tyrosine-type recombinase/integrase, partial [Proteobacteria bacterium]|nr:tyrosine-type recombinase/integrase [Pseudomonadota bacterium]